MKVICFLLKNNIVSSERLSIIDLNSGKTTNSGTKALGWFIMEKYNHQELRDGVLAMHFEQIRFRGYCSFI
jgi:hypothetical protein